MDERYSVYLTALIAMTLQGVLGVSC